MRNIVYSSLLLSAVCFFYACSKKYDFPDRDWAYIITRPVTNINDNGATLNAEILSLGNEEIIDCGFLWGVSLYKDSLPAPMIKAPERGKIHLTITYDLEKDVGYEVQAYIRSKSKVVYGNIVSFESKGSIPPVISSFSPEKGVDNTLLTIKGSYFSPFPYRNIVKIGNTEAKVIECSSEQITVKTPEVNYFGEYPVSITVAGRTVIADQLYVILGPEIQSFNPSESKVGSVISLTGNFYVDNRDGVQIVFNDYFEAEILQVNQNNIEIMVPNVGYFTDPSLYVPVKVVTGKKTSDPIYFKILQSWFPYKACQLFSAGGPITGVSVLEKGYVFNEFAFFEYDPTIDNWRKLKNLPATGREYSFLFNIGNSIYMGGGIDATGDHYSDFWEYKIIDDQWIRRADLPKGISGATGISLDGLGFVFGGEGNDSGVQRYDPSNDSWTALNDTNNTLGYFINSMIINNRIYLRLGKSSDNFCEYVPSSNTWKKCADFPGEDYCVALSINEKGYIFNQKMFEYDPIADTWLRRQDYPACTNYAWCAGFTLNQKGYIGSFGGSWSDCNDHFYYFNAD